MYTSSENVYCLIPVKNWKLSLAELVSFLDARECRFEVADFSRSFFVFKAQTPLKSETIEELGGTLKIAQALASIPAETMVKAFFEENKEAKKQLRFELPLEALAQQMPRAESGKAVFGVSVYYEDPTLKHASRLAQRYLGSALKDELKEQGKKARFMGFPHDRQYPQLTPVEVLKQGLVESHSEVLLCIGTEQTAIGATVAVHNPFEFQKRDVEKPVQRKIFAIPPRLARILMNLARCMPGKDFLDPFCGVGTILQEALLAGTRVVGMDISRWCVDAAKRNLDWIRHEYSLRDADFTVLQGDVRDMARRLRGSIDCIATEPDLGPALREVPTEPYARRIVDGLKPLFEEFLSESYQVLREGGYLAVVTPYVRVRSGKPVTMGIQKIAEDIGFTAVRPFAGVAFVGNASDFPLRDMTSFIEVDEWHKVGREITIYKKPD